MGNTLDADSVEAVVCKEDELKDGEMKSFEVGEGKVLLVRDKGEYYALGTKCSHYGAPLEKGVLSDGRIRCPFHGACFNIRNGDIEDFPGLDSLPKYEVNVSGGEVKVRCRKAILAANKCLKPMTKRSSRQKQVYLIVGGGGAGSSCAETLRQEGFQGQIILASKEKNLPYDRPKLSKAMDAGSDKLCLRKPDFYKEHYIDVQLDKEVIGVELVKKEVKFKDGEVIKYDKVMFATGGRPRTLDLPGKELQNVCYLRSIEDGNYIAEKGAGKDVVIIGTSFIGLEVAAYFISKEAKSVTVVGRSSVPLKQVLGEEVGTVVRKLLEDKGVKFAFSNPPKEFLAGEDGSSLSEVMLQDGTKLPAQMCVVGTGVTPSTDYLADSDVQLSKDGFIQVNKNMKTNLDDVYAAGDIVEFPLFLVNDKIVNIQHWQMSCMQGHVAGQNMAGKSVELKSVPFFWTMILGKSIRYAGYGEGHDDVIIHGDLEGLKFTAYYTKGDQVIAVATLGTDPLAAKAADVFYRGKTITKAEIQTGSEDWTSKE